MDWDVIIVGAGPAGSVSAGLIAARDHRVLLLDRVSFPRSKPCGESLNPGSVRELASLGLLSTVQSLPHRPISGWRIHPDRGPSFEGRFPSDVAGMGVDRSLFDAALLQHAVDAGVTLRTGARVVDLLRRNSGIEGVRTATGESIRARLVVGADGLRSIVVRRLGLLRRGPVLRKLALTAHVASDSAHSSIGELYIREWGCAGVAAVDTGMLNVVLVLGSPTAALAGDTERHFDQLLRTIPGLEGALRVSDVLATGPFDWPTRRVTADGALLVGDAAGYYDPFTGQGIFRALRGATLAARAADACLRSGDASHAALDEYERAHRVAFASGRRLQRVIEAATARPPVLRAAALAFRMWPILPDRLVAVTGDLLPIRTLLLPHTSLRE